MSEADEMKQLLDEVYLLNVELPRLRSELEEARGRIGEMEALASQQDRRIDELMTAEGLATSRSDMLEVNLATEKKCHRLANTMRFQQEDRDRARIAELSAAIKPFAEAETENEAINADETVLWEQSASGNITYGDLRTARTVLEGDREAAGASSNSSGTFGSRASFAAVRPLHARSERHSRP